MKSQMNAVVRFFDLLDAGELPQDFESLQLLAHPPATSSEAAKAAAPELQERLARLHVDAYRRGG